MIKLTFKSILSFFLVTLSGVYVAYRMKFVYISFFSDSLVPLYPLLYWAEAIAVGVLIAWILFLTEKVVLSIVFDGKTFEEVCFANSITYSVGVLFFPPFTMSRVFFLFCFTKILLLLYYRTHLKEKYKNIKVHLMAFIAIAVSQSVFVPFVSPQGWDNPLSSINKDESMFIGPASTSQMIQYTNAKKFDFLGFDQAAWGSIPFSVNSGRSYLTPWIVNLFDLPVIDTESQVRHSLVVALVWMIAGSFAFYLYLHLALKLAYFSSLMGGILFATANPFLAEQFTCHFPMFYGPYLTFPFALLFSRIAFPKRSWVLGFLSGVLFSFHFYGFQNHPDTVIHSYLLWTTYLLFLLFLTREAKAVDRFKIVVSGQLGFFLVGQFPLSPSIDNILNHELSVIGHRQGIYLFYGIELGRQIVLYPVLWLSFILPFVFPSLWKRFRAKNIPIDFTFYSILIFLFLFCFLPGNDSLFFQLLTKLKVQVLNFRQTARILMYFSFSILVILMYGVDWYLQSKSKTKKTEYLALILSTFLLCLFLVKKFDVYKSFIAGGLVLLLILLYCIFKWSKSRLKACALTAILFFILLQYGSLNWLGEQVLNNPNKCKYYTSLGSLLTKVPLFPEDEKLNKAVVQNRLVRFQKDWIDTLDSNRTFDKAAYPEVTSFMREYSLGAPNANVAVSLAEKLYPEIDHFYFHDYTCVHPKYKIQATDVEQGNEINYNLMGLFKGLPDRFTMILNRAINISTMGVGQGLLLQNSASVIPEFFKHYAPINALYLIPGEYFLKVGGFRLIHRVTHEGSEIFSDVKTRKMYNLGGLQLFLVKENDADALKKIPNLEILKTPFAIPYKVPYIFVKDHLAYDTAYFASKIEFISPKYNRFEKYTHPLHDEADIAQYKSEVDFLHDKLLSLKEKHSIFLEDEGRSGQIIQRDAANSVKILNILGSGALFQVSCKKEPCQFVYNMASLKGWKSFIDGKQLPIQRANFAFLSVAVPVGDHLIWFEYHPALMVISLFVALGTVLFLLLKVIASKAKQSR